MSLNLQKPSEEHSYRAASGINIQTRKLASSLQESPFCQDARQGYGPCFANKILPEKRAQPRIAHKHDDECRLAFFAIRQAKSMPSVLEAPVASF